MSTVNELIEEIKKGCPELSDSINTLKSNIHQKTLSKVIKKQQIKTQKKPKVKKSTSKSSVKSHDKPTVKSPDKPPEPPDKPPEPHVPAEPKKSSEDIPFSSVITNCNHTNFTSENIAKIRSDSFIDDSEYFNMVTTNDDGNCGYHSVIQGLIECYYIMGNKSNDYLKQFIKDIENVLEINPKEIVVNNRQKNKIDIPREVVNHFRQFILEVEDPIKKMPDGRPIHIFERENEVPEVKWNTKKEQYMKARIPTKQYKKNQTDNKKVYDNINGGIKMSDITSTNWLREEVVAGIVDIFGVAIYSFLTYEDTTFLTDKIVNTPVKCKEGIKGCGHVIFMVNDGSHFTYLKTDIQDYNNNILKCLGLDIEEKSASVSSLESDQESDQSSSQSDKSSSQSDKSSSQSDKPGKSSTNPDIKTLMNLGISKAKAKTLLEKTGNVKLAANIIFNTISSSSTALDSVLSESDLNKLDFSKNKKLYEKELFKIIRKKMPNEPEHKIQKVFNDKIKEIKSKYMK